MPLTIGWARDERDSVVVAHGGRYARVNLEWSAAGDVQYLRANFQVQQYLPLTNRITLGLNAELGIGKGLGGKPYPVFKNFYGGGLGSVRVFEQGSLGVDRSDRRVHRRRQEVQRQCRVVLSGARHRQRQVAAHVRASPTWATSGVKTKQILASDLRASAGFGLSWISPVGPLKMSWGKPVKSKSTDRIQQFQFQIGTAF